MKIKNLQRKAATADWDLSRLSPQARAVVLHHRDGWTIDQIAARSSISAAMAKQYLADAIQQCSRHIPSLGRKSPMNDRIRSEVADWLFRRETGELNWRTRERFNGWRNPKPIYSSPSWFGRSLNHLLAFVELSNSWEDARHHDSGRTIDVDALLPAARTESNVIPLGKGRSAEPGFAEIAVREHRAAANSRLIKWAAAAALVVVITAGLRGVPRPVFFSGPQEYVTKIGEQRTVSLPDGSTVELDGASRIRVSFSARERRVDLLAGQALFKVAKNAERPFLVTSGKTRIRDVGTQFNVNKINSETILAVLEGKVAVTNSCLSTAPIEVGAGQQVVVTCKTISRREPANLAATTAWTRRQLIFDSTPLLQVAVEFNRFNDTQLEIDGTQLQKFPMGGVFSVSDPTSLPRLLRFLQHAQPGIQLTEAGDRITVTQK